MRLSRIAVSFASLILLATTAQATTYFVAPAGNDGNAGTATAPFRTITKAASIARPGDVVNARGGVYNEIVMISSKGTASAPIVFQSYSGETAIIDGVGSAPDTNLVQFTGAEYVDFTGFEVRNATRIGICGWGGRFVRIMNNDVHHALRNGIYFGYSTFGSVSDITIDGNRVHDNVLENQYHTWSSGWSQAIGVSRGARVRVTNNGIYQNDGEGIAFILSDNGLARGNDVSDSFSVGIYLDNARYTTVDANFVYSSGNSRYFRGGYPAAGIASANEQYSTSNPLTDLTITNNIVVDTKWGFYYGAYGNGGGLKNSTIANNSFHKASVAMIWIQADANANNSVRNNILYQSGGGEMFSGSASGTLFASNNWYGGNAGTAAGAGDILGDPRFVNAGGRTAADYKLTALSPAITAGIDLTAISTDFWGGARSAAYDIGAHEYSAALGGGTPPADTSAPSVPGNFWASPSTTSAQIYLGWNASNDNVGVTGYKIYRGGAHIATVTATSWTDSGLTYSTVYTYGVKAIDAAGNESAQAVTSATTKSAGPPPDTQAPTTPTNFWASPSTSSARIYLGWNAATDNVGVTGYKIYRGGVHVATVTTPSWTDDSGLAYSTTYVYGVSAIDAAGNESGRATVSVTTKSLTKKRTATH